MLVASTGEGVAGIGVTVAVSVCDSVAVTIAPGVAVGVTVTDNTGVDVIGTLGVVVTVVDGLTVGVPPTGATLSSAMVRVTMPFCMLSTVSEMPLSALVHRRVEGEVAPFHIWSTAQASLHSP